MNFLQFSKCTLVFLLLSGTSLSQAGVRLKHVSDNIDQPVRVRLASALLPLEIEGDGIEIKGVKSPAFKNISIPRDESYTVDQVTVKGSKIWILKQGDRVVRVSGKFLEIFSHSSKMRINGISTQGPLMLSSKGSEKRVDVVAAIKLNDYLLGVMAAEMPWSWPSEALKAQAIAARSYTLFKINTHTKDVYQLEAGVLDQAFTPDIPDSKKDKIQKILNDTSGLVLTENGELLEAFYHSDCGGQTEDAGSVWGEKVSFHGPAAGVADAHCAFNPGGKWTLKLNLEEVRSKLQSAGYDIGDLVAVRIASRTESGRAGALVLDDGERTTRISGNDFRRALGFSKLKSTLFSLEQNEKTLVFAGRGNGHGSGLCQWGARYMAQKGSTMKQILNHYFPRAQLQNIEVHVADK